VDGDQLGPVGKRRLDLHFMNHFGDSVHDIVGAEHGATLVHELGNRQAVARAFESDNRLQYFVAKREKKYFEEQSEMMATFIRILGIFITVIFSTGATIGAMITMYGSVANRTTEIGTLRALGFFRRSILLAFLLESLGLALAGGLLGLGIASVLQFFTISTLNFGSFSELAFSFALSPSIVAASLGFALLMGLVGGFLPALRASRLDIIQALRAV